MKEHFNAVADEIAALGLSAFPDLFFTGYKGARPLCVFPERPVRCRYVRVQSDKFECLHLAHMKITESTPAGERALQPIGLRTSSVYGSTQKLVDDLALFSDELKNFGFHTDKDKSTWVEIDLGRNVEISSIVIANREDGFEDRAWSINVETYSWSRVKNLLYSATARAEDFATLLESIPSSKAAPAEFREATALVYRCAALITRSQFKEAQTLLKTQNSVPRAQRGAIRRSFNRVLLPRQNRLWNPHGIRRTFRFWSREQQQTYIKFTNVILGELQDLTPHVCMGFGTVLAAVRDRALLPHDDDLDIIISFPIEECPTLTLALQRVSEHLSARGYEIRGDFKSHRQIFLKGRKSIDVFVGLEEGERVSWNPQPRANLLIKDVFPTMGISLMGIKSPYPRNPYRYLEAVYGPEWRIPNARWFHKWKNDEYADIL